MRNGRQFAGCAPCSSRTADSECRAILRANVIYELRNLLFILIYTMPAQTSHKQMAGIRSRRHQLRKPGVQHDECAILHVPAILRRLRPMATHRRTSCNERGKTRRREHRNGAAATLPAGPHFTVLWREKCTTQKYVDLNHWPQSGTTLPALQSSLYNFAFNDFAGAPT